MPLSQFLCIQSQPGGLHSELKDIKKYIVELSPEVEEEEEGEEGKEEEGEEGRGGGRER